LSKKVSRETTVEIEFPMPESIYIVKDRYDDNISQLVLRIVAKGTTEEECNKAIDQLFNNFRQAINYV